ncbi:MULTISPECIES: glycosyltransferase [Rhodomicrobium]|uniref:glycosyltransferase n=1 Tax=Rhodomicrobium TaxID=1068 RepID=UPI001FDA02B6|nr:MULTISPECIES: glycosyltransferase [Rhodomicrobium]
MTLRSGFELNPPNYQLIFCCARSDDPVLPVVDRLMRAYPKVRARILIGEETGTANPKLGNLVKGWHAAPDPWIIMADSNVLMPPDYIEQLFDRWRPDTGLVCSPPIGCMPEGFWAQLECALLNGYQARWQYTADSLGLGFAQGKTMLWRRADLEAAGGIRALADEIAEDAAATKLVRRLGLRVRLVGRAFGQPLGRRSLRQVWSRQLRWARLRRATFPACFTLEIFAGSLPPLLAGLYAADALGLAPGALALALCALWFGSEALLTRAAGWHLSAASPLAWALRDLMLPVLWVGAWVGDDFSWRGNDMHLNAATVPRGRQANGWLGIG